MVFQVAGANVSCTVDLLSRFSPFLWEKQLRNLVSIFLQSIVSFILTARGKISKPPSATESEQAL